MFGALAYDPMTGLPIAPVAPEGDIGIPTAPQGTLSKVANRLMGTQFGEPRYQTMPEQLVRSVFGALALPGDVATGKTVMAPPGLRREDVTDVLGSAQPNDDTIGRSADLAGLVMGGTSLSAPVGAAGAGPARLKSAVADAVKDGPMANAANAEAEIMAARNAGLAAAMAKRQKALDKEIAAGKIAPGSELTFAEQQADLRRASRQKVVDSADNEVITPSVNTGARLDSAVMRALKNDGPTFGAGAADKRGVILPAAVSADNPASPYLSLLDTPKQGIRAYHGSPHDFDKFDLSKIGTGEGHQAYGHGLYFAESEGVAKSYRDALSDQLFNLKQKASPWDGVPDEEALRKLGHATRQAQFNGDKAAARDHDNVAAWIRSGRSEDFSPGKMYEVNIDADPAKFLDWDKPLRYQPNVVKALEPHTPYLQDYLTKEELMAKTPASMPGELVYDAFRQQANPEYIDAATWATAAPKASKVIHEAGIPGIKYLDQGSRGAGAGSSNYVVFNDKLIDIMRKYGIAGIPAAGAVGGGFGSLAPDQGL